MTRTYAKGAEWRKWDLHLHTPSSYDYSNKAITDKEIIEELSSKNIALVAITDHHVMDLARIKSLQSLGATNNITVLPGIEFLSDARGSEPIHFIGIFPENCNLDYVWGQIQNNTEIRKIIGETKKPNEVYCDLADTMSLIHKLGGIVTIHSGQKHGSIEKITNSLAHTIAQKTDIANIVDIYELGKSEDQKGYRDMVFPAINKKIPMILCSDNHNIKDYILKESCWYKADTTFEGLKQVVNEPEDRVFIGKQPEIITRVSAHRTKYIKELTIKPIDDYDNKEGKWFENVIIPFNSELVAIIGNKGSGKSAISDIISLCSNYHSDDDFSFLTKKKFREKNGRIAKNFIASLVWQSETIIPKVLSADADDSAIKDVKYLPQGQFERLTNEISSVQEFQKEIEKVVFSHIDETERLGAHSFADLIAKKKKSVEMELSSLFDDIDTINDEIIKIESKKTKAYKTANEQNLKKKQDELSALIEPTVISNPNDDPLKKAASETVVSQITSITEDITSLQVQKTSNEAKKKQYLQEIQTLTDIKHEVEIKAQELSRFIAEKKDLLAPFAIDIGTVISYRSDCASIDAAIDSRKLLLSQIKEILGELVSEAVIISLKEQIEQKEELLKIEKAKLDSEQKKYQDYLTAVSEWQYAKSQIIGNSETFDTIEYYKAVLVFLESELPRHLDEKYQARKQTTCAIFRKKQEIVAIYKEIKTRLNEIIAENSDTLTAYRIEVNASLVKKSDFSSLLFARVNHNKTGTFYSTAGAEKQLLHMTSDIDFDNEDSVIIFLDKIINALFFDKRPEHNNAERVVVDQINDIYGLYNYLFKLDFLDYNYQLKQGNKQLEQLSPGERGALLLVFYLLLDKNDIPLIIDQPEDNLDNHSVATVLVPFIRAAKKKRQIIMVTHNPYLAIVSDAEQVIHVHIDKEDGNRFSVVSGSIENPDVNKKIVNVLEGAMKAFNTRKCKYHGA